MLNCKHMLKAGDLSKVMTLSYGPQPCPWCEIERLREALSAIFHKEGHPQELAAEALGFVKVEK